MVCGRFRGLTFLSTPSARRATIMDYTSYPTKEFLSTPSARRATSQIVYRIVIAHISIHALREEGDWQDPTM